MCRTYPPQEAWIGSLAGSYMRCLMFSVYFLMGVVIQRTNIMERVALQLLRRPWLRILPLLANVGLVLMCVLPPKHSLIKVLFPNAVFEDTGQIKTWTWWENEADLAPNIAKQYLVIPVQLLLMLAWALATPVSRIPIITDGGTRSLIAYIFNMFTTRQLVFFVTTKLKSLLPSDAQGALPYLWALLVVPLVTLVMTSEFVAVATWPIVTPTWAVALLTGRPTEPPPVVERWARAVSKRCMRGREPRWWGRWGPWVVCLPLFVLVTVAMIGLQTFYTDEQNRWTQAGGVASSSSSPDDSSGHSSFAAKSVLDRAELRVLGPSQL
jgi:hypothetical protein